MKEIITDSRAVAVKELRQLRRDPISLVLSFLFPIAMIGIFITLFTFQAASYNIPIAVADLDDATLSRNFIDDLSTSKIVRLIEVASTEGKALGSVRSGDATVAVIIPKGFSNLVPSGNAFIVLAVDESKSSSAALAQAETERIVKELVQSSGQKFDFSSTNFQIISRPVSGRPPNRDAVIPGLLGMIIILGGFEDAINAISRERERGTFPRLALTPVNVLSVYIGKTLATLVLTVMRTSLMLLMFILIGLTIRGDIILIYITTCLMAVFTLGVGLVFSSRVKSSVALTILEIAMAFPLLLLTGATRSPEILPSSGRMISRLLPWTYGNETLRRIIYLGLGWQAVTSDLLILLLSGLVLFPIAAALFKRSI